jgi:hypothetical protein
MAGWLMVDVSIPHSDRQQFIIGKFMKKIKKVKTPSFLGDIVVKEVDVGRTAP